MSDMQNELKRGKVESSSKKETHRVRDDHCKYPDLNEPSLLLELSRVIPRNGTGQYLTAQLAQLHESFLPNVLQFSLKVNVRINMDELGIIYLDFPRVFDTVSLLVRKITKTIILLTRTHKHSQKSNGRTVTMGAAAQNEEKKSNCRISKDHFIIVRGNPPYCSKFVLCLMVQKFILCKLDFHCI